MLDSKGRGEYHAFLSLSVHPDHRATGVADALLPWLEARAHQVFAAVADGRSLTLRLDAYEEAERDTTARQALLTLYQQHGYQFAMAEDEMRRDLSLPIPAYPLPAGMNWVTWTPERAGLFFQVYDAAFRTRPGFPGWNEETWRHNFTGYDEFRPDLSMLLMSGDEPTGYAVCSVEGQEGWIVQMGTHPSYRRRGLGGMTLAEVMRRFQVEGLQTAVLQVNVNNPEATSLYRRLGFEPSRRFISYRKIAAAY
jgi:ribosomal protein S18 acetylase RimI-like enzyme